MRVRVVVVALACALSGVGTADAADVGANDDTGKYAADAGASFYAEMASLGLRQTVITVRWTPSDPLALRERPLLDLTVAAARAAGLQVVFATYPYPPREVEAGLARPEALGAWLSQLAGAYPDVRQFVVGNEPNQPAFWRPQFERRAQSSARAFGPFLAAGYDALKRVDRSLTVVGVAMLIGVTPFGAPVGTTGVVPGLPPGIPPTPGISLTTNTGIGADLVNMPSTPPGPLLPPVSRLPRPSLWPA